jgi:hypothetical protein
VTSPEQRRNADEREECQGDREFLAHDDSPLVLVYSFQGAQRQTGRPRLSAAVLAAPMGAS